MFTFRKNGHFYERVGKKGEPICIDDEILFEVPNNWELCRLENLCYLLNPRTEEKGNYPYLNAKFLRTKDNPEIKEKGRFIEKSTKVILVDGENSGEVFLTHVDGYMGSTFRILYINSEMYDEYILKLLELWKNPLKKSKKGAAIPHLNKDIFNKILVGIPPINEQKRILNEVNRFYPFIKEYALNKNKLDKLNSEFPDKLRSSILQEAIQGKLVPQDPNDEPASELLEKIRDEKERLIKEKKIKRNKKESYIFKENNHFYEMTGKNEPICIDDEIPFEIPDNWVWTRIKNISEFVTKGTTPKGGKSAYINEGIKFLRVENIGKNGELILDNIKYIDEDIHENFLKRSILKENDLLISIAGALGRTAIIPKDALPLNTNQAVSLVRWFNTDYIFVPFIEKAINSPEIQKLLLKQSKITAIPNLTLEIIRECLIPFPPLPEQRKIVNKINCLFEELF